MKLARLLVLAAALLAAPLSALAQTAYYPLVLNSGQFQQLPSTGVSLFRAPTTSNASIRLPHGTAPSSPVNGDCWTTTAGLYCYINGVTVGPYGAGSVTSVGSGTGLTGGPITGSGTLSLASIANHDLLANTSGGSAAPVATTLSALIDDAIGSTQGNILYRGASVWSVLAPGMSGQLLQTGGASANPSWVTAGGGGGGPGNVSTSGSITTDGMVYWAGATSIASTAAPTNGQLLIGSTSSNPVLAALTAGTGITITNGAGSITVAATGSTTIVSPQGRLTLVTGTPVMTSDQTAKSQVFYDCHVGNNVPYYTGSADSLDTIASCEVSLTMQTSGTGVTNNAGVFDIWWVHGGANRICVATNGSGGGWASDTGGSNTARGTGYSQVHNTRGYWTNVNAILHCYNATTDYGSVSADQATLLGCLTTTAAGQTGVQFLPSAAAGGSNTFVGLANVYNKERRKARNQDSNTSWTQTSNTWTALDGNNNNRVSFVDCLDQNDVRAWLSMPTTSASGNTVANLGFWLDATSGSPSIVPVGAGQTNGSANTLSWQAIEADFGPAGFGLHFVEAAQANLNNSGSAATFFGLNNSNGVEQLLVEVAY